MNDYPEDDFDPGPQPEDDPIWANAPVLHFQYPSDTGISLADLQALFKTKRHEPRTA